MLFLDTKTIRTQAMALTVTHTRQVTEFKRKSREEQVQVQMEGNWLKDRFPTRLQTAKGYL
nr:unnamed protein product [Callosobruchus analis]